MFYFVVRHLRWLARVPLLPQFFDAMLLALTWIFRPSRIQAMEELEAALTGLPGVTCRRHRYGGIEFHHLHAGDIGHIHGHGLLDVRLPRSDALRLIQRGQVRPHHVWPNSGWVSFQLETSADVPFAKKLLELSRVESLGRTPGATLPTEPDSVPSG